MPDLLYCHCQFEPFFGRCELGRCDACVINYITQISTKSLDRKGILTENVKLHLISKKPLDSLIDIGEIGQIQWQPLYSICGYRRMRGEHVCYCLSRPRF